MTTLAVDGASLLVKIKNSLVVTRKLRYNTSWSRDGRGSSYRELSNLRWEPFSYYPEEVLELLKQFNTEVKSNELNENDKVYFTKQALVSRNKFRAKFKNKIVRDPEKADKIIVPKKFNLRDSLGWHTFLYINSDGVVCQDNYGEGLKEDCDLTATYISKGYGPTLFCYPSHKVDNILELFESINLNKSIYDTDLNKLINGVDSVEINEVYSSLDNMFKSSSGEDTKMAMEILSNVTYDEVSKWKVAYFFCMYDDKIRRNLNVNTKAVRNMIIEDGFSLNERSFINKFLSETKDLGEYLDMVMSYLSKKAQLDLSKFTLSLRN